MPGKLDYKSLDLERVLPSGQVVLLRQVADAAAARQLPLYLVGGFVRDLLLGNPAADFDLVVEGDAISLARGLAVQYGGKVTAHARFGTAQWFQAVPGWHPLDFISTRSETYKHPAALPTVMPGTLVDDLIRRDFSINTLAIRLDGEHWGELRDDLSGLEDLEKGLVRVLHPASFQDDPTRLFRAVRYEQRYGFQIVPETMALMPAAYSSIGLLSAERIRHELDLILEEKKAALMLDRLADLDLLRPVHPALTWNEMLRERFNHALKQLPKYSFRSIPAYASQGFLNWHFWLMDLSLTDLESLERRLHFSSRMLASLFAVSALSASLPSFSGRKPSQWVAQLEDLPVTAIHALFLASPEGQARQNLFNFLQTWRHVKPKTNGHDLEKRGLVPGPRYQLILQRLRDAWLNEEVKTDDEELKLLDKVIKLV